MFTQYRGMNDPINSCLGGSEEAGREGPAPRIKTVRQAGTATELCEGGSAVLSTGFTFPVISHSDWRDLLGRTELSKIVVISNGPDVSYK